MNTSITDYQYNIQDSYNSTFLSVVNEISANNKQHIFTITHFSTLKENWDSYGALKPSATAITQAISFVINLASKELETFFVAPTPDGDILVELKNNSAHLEFIFSADVENLIIGSDNGKVTFEHTHNDTTYNASLKWLICPDGNCLNF